MSICAVHTVTFESLDLEKETSFFVCRYASTISRPPPYIKVTGLVSR